MVQSTFPSYQLKGKNPHNPPLIVLSFRLAYRKRKSTLSPHVKHKYVPKNKKDVLEKEIKTLLNSTK